MTYKRRALLALTKQELLEIGRAFELEVAARMSVDEVRDVVARSKRATLDRILLQLSRDNLKGVCAELGRPADGRDEQPSIERILEPAQSGPDGEDADGARPAPAEPERETGQPAGQIQMWQTYPVVAPSAPPPPETSKQATPSSSASQRGPRRWP